MKPLIIYVEPALNANCPQIRLLLKDLIDSEKVTLQEDNSSEADLGIFESATDRFEVKWSSIKPFVHFGRGSGHPKGKLIHSPVEIKEIVSKMLVE